MSTHLYNMSFNLNTEGSTMSQGLRINTKNINIRTNPEILDLVRIEAKVDDMKASKWIRTCLIKELKVRGYHMDQIVPIVQNNKENGVNANKPANVDSSAMGFLD